MPSLLSRSFLAIPATALLMACGGGGGGSSEPSGTPAELLRVVFPDPQSVNEEAPDHSPQNCPLNQEVRFEFATSPSPSSIGPETLPILDATGRPVVGTYRVEPRAAVFSPHLVGSMEEVDTSPGFRPDMVHSIRLSSNAAIAAKSPALQSTSGALTLFIRTTSEPSRFFLGSQPRTPRLEFSDPSDGAVGISPFLYTDPDGHFPGPKPFRLRFDAPLHPETLDGFQLFDLDDRTGADPTGRRLATLARIVEQSSDHCLVEVRPSGILPFGHLLSLEFPQPLQGLAQLKTESERTQIAATFTVAFATSETIRDELRENFRGSSEPMESDASETEFRQATWNAQEGGGLEPTILLTGSGELGRFSPLPPAPPEDPDLPTTPREVLLDTDSQWFPLTDGSTPDLAERVHVAGGKFAFTDIEIPEGVRVRARGTNPLFLTASGSVRIAGEIHLSGANGRDEFNFDSAVSSNPGGLGGPGGGRGGEGQPLLYAQGSSDVSALLSPPRGGRGWGASNQSRIGGQGGQSGILDHPNSRGKLGTDHEINCHESNSDHNNGYRPPGGGGGSFAVAGKSPQRDGIGNVITDGFGNYLVREESEFGDEANVLTRGQGASPLFDDEDPDNDFFGAQGEFRQVFGGQGGGAGGSALDGYYCGQWCKLDSLARNDRLCEPEGLFENNPDAADSSVDARGGGGGGGGGSLIVEAMGPVVLETTARLAARGGNGGGGEQLGCSNWAGSGGGGSGGAIVLRSATSVDVEGEATIDVSRGEGAPAEKENDWVGFQCQQLRDNVSGAGGHGGRGLIQLQVPPGKTAQVGASTNLTNNAWVDPSNERNPVDFHSTSGAVSHWFDMGRTVNRPPHQANPRFRFRGLDRNGFVRTDDSGFVPNPRDADARVNFLGVRDPLIPTRFLPGLEPKGNFVPRNASIRIEFQGGHPLREGGREVDPESMTDWHADASIADGHQFIRFRVTFDVGNSDEPLSRLTPIPTLQWIRIRTEF